MYSYHSFIWQKKTLSLVGILSKLKFHPINENFSLGVLVHFKITQSPYYYSGERRVEEQDKIEVPLDEGFYFQQKSI